MDLTKKQEIKPLAREGQAVHASYKTPAMLLI
jgi:hypothetical protein